MTKFYLVLASLFIFATAAISQTGPHVLIVDAHPDDETAYAATVYKITHDLHGLVDLVVVTNGEAGYKYSTLANAYYGLDLTNEAVGRKYLPGIREKELNAAGKIIGLHHIYYLHQKDNHYTMNQHEVLDDTSHVWNIPLVRSKLKSIMTEGKYDFLFNLLPTDSTHGHHKAATILSLEALSQLPATVKHPVALAGNDMRKGGTPMHFSGLAGYPITNISDGLPSYTFDRSQSFGFHHILNYNTIVAWEVAEHKSQGTMQMGLGDVIYEQFYYYDINPPEGRQKAKDLFDKLAINYYPELTYPGVK